jgi:hypothetical protein
MFEQHWALLAHGSDWTRQISPLQVPPLQLRSQQSVACSQAAPIPRQMLVHRVTPAMPCTGSHRPLQQSFVGPGVHATSGARQPLASRHWSTSQRPLQHAPADAQVAPGP